VLHFVCFFDIDEPLFIIFFFRSLTLPTALYYELSFILSPSSSSFLSLSILVALKISNRFLK
jgi:hypothetical protein